MYAITFKWLHGWFQECTRSIYALSKKDELKFSKWRVKGETTTTWKLVMSFSHNTMMDSLYEMENVQQNWSSCENLRILLLSTYSWTYQTTLGSTWSVNMYNLTTLSNLEYLFLGMHRQTTCTWSLLPSKCIIEYCNILKNGY